MASPQSTQERPPKIYLRNDVYRPPLPEAAFESPYRQTDMTFKAGNTTVYGRRPSTVPRQSYQAAGLSGAPYYVQESTLPPRQAFHEDPNDSPSMSSKSNQRSLQRHHHHVHHNKQRIEDPDGYWKVPHANLHERAYSTLSGPYVTPGGRQLSHTPKKHTAGVQVVDSERLVSESTAPTASYSDLTREAEEYTQSSQYPPSAGSEMTITFHYDPTADLATGFGEDMLVRMQAQCRAYLAKKRCREEEAVRIIQRNAALYFDPWFRLFLVLTPRLKCYRLEEKIALLKSEIEKYKAMVNVLRYENVAYQDKISRLLTLLDQMHPDGTSKDLVSKLIKELSMAVADHQKQWRNMVAQIPASEVNGISSGISAVTKTSGAETAMDEMTKNSYKQAQDNAEFYREQLEMLREDVEAQNARISQHYEEKIGVLSERVEQLQNMLTQESYRVERLNGELEAANSQLVEAREAEANMTSMIDDLRGELHRRRDFSASEPGTPGEPMIVANTVESTYAAAPQLAPAAQPANDKQEEQMSALKKMAGIRNFLAENPEIYESLKDTPLGQGGDLDILSTADRLGGAYLGGDGSLGRSTNSIFHSLSHVENYHLGRAQEMENRYDVLQQKLEEEVGYREDLELEAQEMRNKISTLQRQVRRQRDEHEEELVEREQAHSRRVRELDNHIDELSREKQDLEKRCLELQSKVEELRQVPDLSDSENGGDDLHDTQVRLAAENRQYQKALDQVRDEFEQYKSENDTNDLKAQLAEKEERISQLEVSQRHTSADMEILNVRLQNANKLLDENEQRLRGLTKERQGLMHRISQLETERDAAVREAASAAGKAGAERETAMTRQRELEDLKHERATYQKELTDMKLHLMETTTKAEIEKSALEKRVSDIEATAKKRESDLKADLDMYKEKVETLQQELSELHKVESATSTDNRHLKRQIRELQDASETSTRRVAELERRNADLSTEVERTRASLSASRETAASLMRERQTLASEGYEASYGADTVEYSDDEETSEFNTNDEITTSSGDLRRRSAGYGAGISGTQTIDRYRNRSRQNPSSRSTSRSRTYNRSNPPSYRQSTPVLTSPVKNASPRPPPPPTSRHEAPGQEPEESYDDDDA